MDQRKVTKNGAHTTTNTNESPQVVTGKRVRKKNPKYIDQDPEPEAPTTRRKTPKRTPKKMGRPKKKRKVSVPDPVVTMEIEDTTHFTEEKKRLENELKQIFEQLETVEKELREKQIEIGAEPIFLTEYPNLGPKKKTQRKSGSRKKTTRRKPAPTKKKPAPKKPTVPKKSTIPKEPAPIVQRPRRSVAVKDEVVLSPELTTCRNILHNLMNHQYAHPFNEPVDYVALRLDDYPSIITHPMDFGTVMKKLNSKSYSTVADFISDVNLIFNNACTYNRLNSDVYIMAETLRKSFKEKIRSLCNNSDISKQIEALTTPSNGTRKKVQQKREDSQPFSRAEMKQLSQGIKSLNPDQLTNVVKIITEKSPGIVVPNKSYSLDLESLNTPTLRALEKFVQSTKKKKSKRTNKKKLSTAIEADPEARLKLAQLTEKGMQSKIESVERQLQELDSGPHSLASSTNSLSTKIETNIQPHSDPILEQPPAPETKEEEGEEESSESESESDSGSDSEESDSESEESNSESITGYNSSATIVEKIVAPIFSAIPSPKVTAQIISPSASEKKVGITASWSNLSTETLSSEPKASPTSGGSNLWSAFQVAQQQQKEKEREKKQHEERLKREKEEKEREQRRLEEEEKKRLQLEEEAKQKELEEKRRLEAERKIEEERLKEQEKKIEVEEDNLNEFSINNFGSFAGSGMNSKLMTDMRLSLKSKLSDTQEEG